MIYLEPHQLGWRPSMQSWLATLPECLKREEQVEAFTELFNWLVDPCIRNPLAHSLVAPFSPPATPLPRLRPRRSL